VNTTPDAFNPRRFRSTVPFYVRYRLGYPESLIARVAAVVGLKPGDAVMDLGCGPGLLAVPFAKIGMHVTGVDPEPDMLAQAQAEADAAGVAVTLLQASSFALPQGIGPFKLVTMGRSFHWMDRAATLDVLDRLVTRDGALAFFDDSHPSTMENAWRRLTTDLANKYGRLESPNQKSKRDVNYRSDESLLFDSGFPVLEICGVTVKRELTADDVIGLARSLSTSSPERLGEKHAQFESELRAGLAELSPGGSFTEIAELAALVAKRA
jgi:2-polyprenyl-3-methyl-5-hydroxy-6-metoxy-1,4-benzoquinol methylase